MVYYSKWYNTYLNLKKKYLKIEDVGELVKEKNKPKKKKKIKKSKKENVKMVVLNEGEQEIQCRKYSYLEKEYYVNVENKYNLALKYCQLIVIQFLYKVREILPYCCAAVINFLN